MRSDAISVEQARAEIAGKATLLGSETLELDHCLGRVSAEQARALDTVPPFDNSAMDGFAVRSQDLAAADADAPVRLRVIDESRAGRPARRGLGPSEAVAISTGAALPQGADAVVPVEQIAEIETGDRGDLPSEVAIADSVSSGEHIRRAGEDLSPGDPVVGPGARLDPAAIGALASIGIARLNCARRPKLAILATGDELVVPGEELGPGQIRDTSSYSIAAVARESGAEPTLRERVPDSRAETEAALERALRHDVVVVCGGVSVGRHDHVKPSLESLGVEEVFWRVAMKPGGPTWFGVADSTEGSSRLVFGLPGNPVSALVTFHLFVRTAISLCQGADPSPRVITARLSEPRRKKAGRAEFIRCRLEQRSEGLTAVPTRPEQSSHLLTSMIGAEGLAVLPAERDEIDAGEPVQVELL